MQGGTWKIGWLTALGACTGRIVWEPPPPPPPIAPGEPQVGAAEGYLALPVGTPLSGYTSRCGCLGGAGAQDDRDSAYAQAFAESTGVQTYPTIKVVWIENGDDSLVIAKTDSIYAYDGLVAGLTERLEAATGETLAGRVVHTTNHSHSSWGSYDHGVSWYLGSDKYNREVFERMLDQVTAVALEAYGVRQPAKIGVSWAVDWDPTDLVYHDRRGENDALQPWGEDGPYLGKDPHLGVIRFDDLAGDPIAVMVNFGMHGIINDDDNSMASSDAGGHVEIGLEESYGADKVVVMFTQGSGGDASPGGEQDGFAKMEALGTVAAGLLRPVIDAVETSGEAIHMETVSRAVLKHHDTIHVTRAGTVDWRYAPYDPDPAFAPDDVVYGANGELLSPIDEFNTTTGAVFCGSGDLALPIGGLGATVFPYNQCLRVDTLAPLIEVFFQLDDAEAVLPLPETMRASATVSRLGPVPTRRPDGASVSEDLFVGFFPGEPVYSFGEQWRRRVHDELGIDDAMMIGYSQDHEGYLLIAEDWLTGGYEPDIGVWGPLEAEHIMEGVLDLASEALLTTDVREDVDPLHQLGPTVYTAVDYVGTLPDPTPDAGARITTEQAYLWTPWVDTDLGDPVPHAPTADDLIVPAQLPRVQGLVQLAWEGGDPMVDAPKVVLERLDAGSWAPVTTAAGRSVDEGRDDILLGHTPTPLYPADAVQTHQWWAAWQAVGHWGSERAALPLGTYRLHVTGARYAGTATTPPWDTVPYEVSSEPFEIVPGALTVADDGAGGLTASLRAPAHGYRLVALGGDETGDNPIVGAARIDIEAPSGSTSIAVDPDPGGPVSHLSAALPTDWTSVTVTDDAGNTGTLTR